MEWIPSLQISWLNGWIPLGLLVLTEGLLFIIFPQHVVKRLFDRSGWSPKQTAFTILGKVFALGCIFLLVFTPIKTGTDLCRLGAILVVLGLCGLTLALLDFRNTPMDVPVEQGIYQVSRHPQIVMATLVLFGGCLAIGSWLALILLLLARLFGHFGILAEEQACLAQYGDAYQDYMDRVARYFLVF